MNRRIRRLRGCGLRLAFALCAAGFSASASAALRMHTTGVPAADDADTQALVDTVATLLPRKFADAIPTDTRLGWRELPAAVHGRARGAQLWLQADLLPAWRQRDATNPAVWRQQPAVRALIHELAHRYDRAATGGVSHDPRFLDLAGWPRKPWPWGGRGADNRMTERSPDAYELTRPAEFFAVNLEDFLLDAQYACRRPALARYFAERFDVPIDNSACAAGVAFVAPAAAHQPSQLLQLDPARIYAVDYLLAEGNQQPMSRWGHSMLRLVICAPHRAPGPDCRLDLAYHQVLSFRAFVGDVQISSWRGLTGSYPSRLFVLPLDQVIDEYTRTELRGLQSLPLRLDAGEIAALVERAAQLHWSYDGRYYFLGNNCAVESWRLLQDGVPRLSAMPLRGITPTGLSRRLIRAGVADDSVLHDRADAERLGFYFAPLSARFDELFAVAKTRLDVPQADATDWLDASPESRRPWLQRGDLRASAALLVLEQAALRREELRVRDLLKRRLLAGEGGEDARVQVQQWLGQGEFLSRPALLLPDGYGLPQAAEREKVTRALASRGAQLQADEASLQAQAKAWLPAQARQRLESTQANVALIGERLRRLAGEPGEVP